MRTFNRYHQNIIDQPKNNVTNTPVLNFFVSLLVKVLSDASSIGLRALLEQEHNQTWLYYCLCSSHLIAINYCQLEKDILSVFACEKLHEYLYGREYNDRL